MLGTLCPRIAKRASLLSSPFFAVIICSNMLALSRKSLGSTTVEPLPLRAKSLIISVHCVNMISAFASVSETPLFSETPLSWMVPSESLMRRAMALRWFAIPLPLSSMASASAFASVTRLMRSASARSCAAAMVRCAALIRFMESSTSRGRPVLVMRVETSWKP